MRVSIITKKSALTDGLSRYGESLCTALDDKVDVDIISLRPYPVPTRILNLSKSLGIDIGFFLENNPVHLERLPDGEVTHILNQNLAIALNFYKIENSVLTLLDVMPLSRDDPPQMSIPNKILYKLALRGAKKAEKVITTSQCIKKDITEYLKIPEDKIEIVYIGLDHRKFKIIEKPHIDYFDPEHFNILYVGSELPRKNLPTLIKAFYRLKKKLPEVKLIKVGGAVWQKGREELNELIKELNLEKDVLFAGQAEESLPLFYNAADLFVFPSLYEGFGLPPLEAMACGCPVIASEYGSLPEVLGNAPLFIDPLDIEGFAANMYEALTNNSLKEELIKKGLERSKMFTLKKYAEETINVYEEIIG